MRTERRELIYDPEQFDPAGLTVRALAGLLGTLTLLNLVWGIVRPGFDANLWWIDLRSLPPAAAGALLGGGGLLLCAWAFQPRAGRRRAAATETVIVLLALACIVNAATFVVLVNSGRISSDATVPLSLFVAAGLVWMLRSVRCTACRCELPVWSAPANPKRRVARVVVASAVVMVLWALAQMYFFGRTDYRRGADAIVVFGAGVYADGTCSDALEDRMRTAVELYAQGYASKVIVSGGPGMGAVHETEAMRDLAVRLGVPGEAICLDRQGVNTRATVANTAGMFRAMDCRGVLAVSHFYHLPRIKLAYQRAGWEVRTVPAKESYPLTAMPYYVTREVAALWCYYLRPLAG